MIYEILCVGKIKESFYKAEISDVCKKINSRGDRISITEIPDVRIPDNIKDDRIEAFVEKECDLMRSKLKGTDYVIALCIEGKELSTDKHREYVKKAASAGKERIVYVIGGSLGLPVWVKERADLKLSFSKLTFPHQLMRMVLVEEISYL